MNKSHTLHPDIIANIKRISKDEAEVKVRMAAALRYARMFPNRLWQGPQTTDTVVAGEDGQARQKGQSPSPSIHYNHTITSGAQTGSTVDEQ